MNITKLRNYEITKLRNYEITILRNYEIRIYEYLFTIENERFITSGVERYRFYGEFFATLEEKYTYK